MFLWFSYDLPIEERLRLIKCAGFPATSLWWKGDGKQLQPDMARKLGLEIDSVHAPFDHPNNLWMDGLGREAYLNMLLSCVDDCKLHNIPTVVLHVTSFSSPIPTSEIGLDRIKRLVDTAETKQINLALENLNDLEHLDCLFSRLNSNRLGFCYDSGHEHCNHPTADCLSRFGDKLFAIHVDDDLGDDDTHLLPWDDTVSWEKVGLQLGKSRELDYLTLEVDFNRSHQASSMYDPLSASEYVQLAFKKATQFYHML